MHNDKPVIFHQATGIILRASASNGQLMFAVNGYALAFEIAAWGIESFEARSLKYSVKKSNRHLDRS